MTHAPDIRRRGVVFHHGQRAGTLDELTDGGFRFQYAVRYLAAPDPQPVSLTLPVRGEPYLSEVLFPFFQGLLAEGSTRQLQARLHRVDPDDAFGLLLATGRDTIGAVTVKPADE